MSTNYSGLLIGNQESALQADMVVSRLLTPVIDRPDTSEYDVDNHAGHRVQKWRKISIDPR